MNDPAALARALAEGQPPDHPLVEMDREQLVLACQAIVDRITSHTVTWEIEPLDFLVFLAQRTAPDGDFLAWQNNPHLEDLALVHACLQQNKAARDHFTTRLVPEALGAAGQQARYADLAQTLLSDLLCGKPGEAPLLHQYQGKGKLQHWLRVAWARRKRNQFRSQQREVSLNASHLERLVAPENSPELNLLKESCAGRFKQAMYDVLPALPDEDKALLKMRFLEGMTLAGIGRVLHLDKGSVSRRFSRIRERIFAHLRSGIGMPPGSSSGLENALGLIESRVDLSVERLLK